MILLRRKYNTIEKSLLRLPKIAHIVLAVMLCAALGIFLGLSFFSWPSAADDLCMANYFEEHGLFGGLYGQYMGWGGAYASYFLMGAVPQLGDYYAFYKFLPLSILLLTVWASTAFSRAVLRLGQNALWHWLLGLGFTMLFLSCMPTVRDGFYWYASAIKYQGANILFVGMLVLFAQLLESTGQKLANRSKDFILVGLCIIAGAGSSETLLILFYAVASLMCMWRITAEYSNRRAALVWLGLLLLVNLCTAIFIFAPGNSVRSDLVGSSQRSLTAVLDVFQARYYSGFNQSTSLEILFTLPQLWWATLVSAAIILNNKRVANKLPPVHGAYVLLGVMLTLLTPIALQLPSLLFLDLQWPPERTENSILFATLLCWFVTLSLFIHWISHKWPSVIARLTNGVSALKVGLRVIYLVALVGFGEGVASASNVRIALNDLINVAPDYDAHMRARLARLEAARDTDTAISIRIYSELPETITWLDIVTPDLDFSACLGTYFGVIPIVDGFDK